MKTYYHIFKTLFCPVILVGNENYLEMLHLDTGKGKRKDFDILSSWIENKSVFEEAERQIKEYILGKRTKFSIKINPKGTDFQKKVWNELVRIPFGKTKTYKDVAVSIGNENASRAVGSANSKNPIPLIIPCHRVVGANGRLSGFAHGIEIKKQLIDMEKNSSLF